VGVIYHKNENFRASGSIRYKCWHSNHFRKKNIFNILFCVQTGFSHSLSVQVAITEYWRMGGLKNKHLFLTVLKARKFKTRAPTELMSGKSPPPGSHTAIFLLYPYMIERRERAHTYVQTLLFLLIKAPNPICEDSTLMTQSSPNSPMITFGVRISTYEFWGGHKYSVYNSHVLQHDHQISQAYTLFI